ncbi:TRAP transporter substrate-binding protein DctP [Bacillus sp. FJAT-45350]|uniref:TRAP transporter substrate-binding protein DctP n=1 Tax=Bacillus sp. FJAT-45350 TaxID=2011014 RepID=UPI000BB8350A|nr:TRAP transporter substrate-binding protein DctP [Bacillus sp. FJAT-45350]
MKRKLTVALGFISLLLFSVACSQNAGNGGEIESNSHESEEQVQFSVVSFLAMDHAFTKDIIPMWMDMIEEATDGSVTFDWLGGDESVPITDQFDAVRNGIVDVGFNVSSYYGHLMPESHSLHISPYTPAEERDNGYFDYLSERFEGEGFVYAGRWLSPSPFYFWSNEKIENLDDLKGLSFRSNPTYHEILLELGVNPMEITPSDVYTSLERNMVDGFGFPLLGPHRSAWTEVTKYIIDEPFLNQNATILFNKDAFNEISPELQEIIFETTVKFEQEMVRYFNDMNDSEWKAIEAAGVERLTLSSEDSQKFQDTVERVYWDMLEKTSPDQVTTLKKLLTN